MNCNEVKINLPEFIDGKLEKELSVQIAKHLEGCEACSSLHSEMRSFLQFTDSIPEVEPPKGMEEEFMQMVETEFANRHTRVLTIPEWIKVAAMIIVVLGTFAGGYFTGSGNQNNQQIQAEINQLKQEVWMTGLRGYSGPQKIEAVYNIKASGKPEGELIDALVYTMNSDKNVNVRLAAINALSGMVNENEKVKSELIHSLSIQKNPLLQISLIQVLTESGIKEAKDEIESISDNENTDQRVREYAKDMVKTII